MCLFKSHFYVPIQNYYKITFLECFQGIINIDATKSRTKNDCVVINPSVFKYYFCIKLKLT